MNRLFSFLGGSRGVWKVLRQESVVGEGLPAVDYVDLIAGQQQGAAAVWQLSGIVSNERYVQREEKQLLVQKQEGLGRVEATRAALIPIRKTAAWWNLSQDERRAIFEEQSKHIQIGLKYLPEIARRLHHCRDLSESEPFDFLTWFEFPPAHEAYFDQLVAELRKSPEWQFVDREVEIRLERAS